ncbi:hypothetical protein [Acinetobacter johnsonii]|uniref:Uncharacterized protein n=1 Tax=Acinetobacter johnsonii TaxID=40214 RepID=A0AAW6RQL3_ACIJO|nr:hypothetical protein [Acinetobacter johnsonii]MDG9786759.1 hypothetical protein [Acinetobacter johnsonii]MDG9799464.1 hypothetical protein [Acinetobacter johnsonii]
MTLLLKSDKVIGEPESLSLKSVQTDQYNTVLAGHKSILNFLDLPDSVADGSLIDDVFILGKQSSVSGAQTDINAKKGVTFVDGGSAFIQLPDAWDLSQYKSGDSILLSFWLKVLAVPAGSTRGLLGWRYSSTNNFSVTQTTSGGLNCGVGGLSLTNIANDIIGQSFLCSIEVKIGANGFTVSTYKNKIKTQSAASSETIPKPAQLTPRIGKIDAFSSANFICHRAFIRKFDSSKTDALTIISDEYDKFFSNL